MPRKIKKKTNSDKFVANEQKGKKICTYCGKEKQILQFYSNTSPLFSLDKRDPICKDCIKKTVVDYETGKINELELDKILRTLDRPYFKDTLESSRNQFAKEHPDIADMYVDNFGDKILGLYFKNIQLRQNRHLRYANSEATGYMHDNSNINISEREKILRKYGDIKNGKYDQKLNEKYESEEIVFSKEWRGTYTKADLEYLDNYYKGLQRDYKIITENHRDYAKKIAKASLHMDKCFDEMMSGVAGADAKYKQARESFDSLSKSAKFSESTRSVNDIGISSFSKITSMVEAHQWIPEHKPVEKDDIDKMIDYLSTLHKSL